MSTDRNNVNLVIVSKNRPRLNEPTGEVETLKGKIKASEMGMYAVRTKPTELLEKMKKRKQKKEKETEEDMMIEENVKKTKKSNLSIFDSSNASSGTYIPRTNETREVYEKLLSFIKHLIGTQPNEILFGAADEILIQLKDENKKDLEKKKEIQEIIGALSDKIFFDLVELAKGITDFSDNSDWGIEDNKEEDIPIVFNEEEESNEDYEIKQESSEENEQAEEGQGEDENTLKSENRIDSNNNSSLLNANDVDAYWLQRKISEFIKDSHESQKMASEILEILENEQEDRECENKLVLLLQYEHFDFVSMVMSNRKTILFCTKYKQAQSQEEKEKIANKMQEDGELTQLLLQLQGKLHISQKSQKNEKISKDNMDTTEDDKQDQKWKSTNKILDLEALSFEGGSHVMTNKKCKLPSGTFRTPKRGYEEVFVPAVKQKDVGEDEKLVSISELPEWAQKTFVGVKSLNRIQSAVYESAFKTNDNMLVCAPTGAGKTNIAMMTILHEIGLNIDQQNNIQKDSFKIVYIAPMKSLVQEMVGNFSKRLEPLGIIARELSGDQNLSRQQISETQIIVTTPEKWDIITRKSGERTFTELVRLVIIDEIHLLHDERGPVLEAIVARTIRQVESTLQPIRLVGLSATLPNYEDVALFLKVKEERLFHFDGSYRPVPLQMSFVGIKTKKAIKGFQMMNQITYEKVMERAGKYQIIVFVHSRKDTAKTARHIRDMAMADDCLEKLSKSDSASREILSTESENAKDKDLKELLRFGLAIHHAGMNRTDRNLVEELFAEGYIQVLVSTATLAWGVNLPAHTVIIKGTQVYNPEKGRWVELSALDVMQMVGRSGRPQYDTTGEGIMITTHSELQYYLSLMNEQLPIESQMMSKLPDIMLSEIVLGTIVNAKEAIEWLTYTYFYICMLRSPQLYGINQSEVEEDHILEKRRVDLVHTSASLLDKAGLISYDRKSGKFQITDIGRVSSLYYVGYKTMGVYNEHLRPHISDIDLFRLFTLSSEFSNIVVRQDERQEMERLLQRVPVPIKESSDEPTAKVNILLQCFISRLKLDGYALASDMVYITQSAARLVRALFEISLKRGWSQLADKTLELAKMIDKRMWPTQSPLRQFKKLPLEIVEKLEKRDFQWSRLYDLNHQELGNLIRLPQQGKNVFKHIHYFPRLELEAQIQPITRATVRIELTINADFKWEDDYHRSNLGFWIIVEDNDSENILFHQYWVLKKRLLDIDHHVSIIVPLYDPMPPQYYVKVISDTWLHSITTLPISFTKLIPPSKNPPHSELLDLQPTPISALGVPSFINFFSEQRKSFSGKSVGHFNPIQTQTFNALFKSDSNVLVCASPGSGTIVCAEFAILRMIQNSNETPSKCVYIAPLETICDTRLKEWQRSFGIGMGKIVVKLSGDMATDLKLIASADIIISTPESWDKISRRWKTRKVVQQISLYILDNLHLMGSGSAGSTFELVVSRLRYMLKIIKKENTRIVALSTSISNAIDVADWIGVNKSNTFNFHPNVRQVPLEVSIQGFDNPFFGARLLSMTRPILRHISRFDRDKPIMIFSHSRKQSIVLAKELKSYLTGTQDLTRFRKLETNEINSILDNNQVQNSTLRYFLSQLGIALYHEALSENELLAVEQLYKSGAVTMLIVSREMSWAVSMSAHLVMVAGTEYYDGQQHKHMDYPITELLEMVGKAGRAFVDEKATCVILAHAPKKSYYKKFLSEPLPVESTLDFFLHNHLCAEISTKTIKTKQECIDYITWTFFYRRLTLNPNYYNLQGNTHRHISDFLSELVENVLEDLSNSKSIAMDSSELSPLNLGMISSYYYINYNTIELFSTSIEASSNITNLLQVLSSATEFDSIITIRRHEAEKLREIARHLPLKIGSTNYEEVSTKINILLQSHFERRKLSIDFASDLNKILQVAVNLVHAMVDVISSESWLLPCLAAMEISQMLVQAVGESDNSLKQLPFFTEEMINTCQKKYKVENIFDFVEMEDKDRNSILKMGSIDKRQTKQIARACDRFPSIDVKFELDKSTSTPEEPLNLRISLERATDSENLSPVIAPYYPAEKLESWWVVLGDVQNNHLFAVKKINLIRNLEFDFGFSAPSSPGNHNLSLYFMCDSYQGVDQELSLELKVNPEDD